MKLSSEAQDLYETKYKAVLTQLNGHWEKCETYDASWAKVQRLWLRVAAVLQTFYFHSFKILKPDESYESTNTMEISKDNLQYAMNLVEYYMDQKAILVKVRNCFFFCSEGERDPPELHSFLGV